LISLPSSFPFKSFLKVFSTSYKCSLAFACDFEKLYETY